VTAKDQYEKLLRLTDKQLVILNILRDYYDVVDLIELIDELQLPEPEDTL